MVTKTSNGFRLRLLVVLFALSLLLTACSTAPLATALPTNTAIPAVTMQLTATPVPQNTLIPVSDGLPQISLDTGNLAASIQTETLAAIPASDNSPYWEVLPAYTRLTLQGYPTDNPNMQPQIFVYPLEELGLINEGARQIVLQLQSLLQSQQEEKTMPFLPLVNAAQVLHVQTQFLDFQNGKGVRYLAQFAQGIVPISNDQLIYTYQGISSDGKYYVAAILPVNHPILPADGKITGNEPPEFSSDFPAYLANVTTNLNAQSADSFSPNLEQLDAMLSSLTIK